jgi:transcriptional regulator with XRE-family HTH domain
MGSFYDPREENDVNEKKSNVTLEKRLRQCRKERGMTMVMLGRVAQCSQSFLSKVESGNIVPSIPMLYRLAYALDVSPRSLLSEAPQSLGDLIAGLSIAGEQDP